MKRPHQDSSQDVDTGRKYRKLLDQQHPQNSNQPKVPKHAQQPLNPVAPSDDLPQLPSINDEYQQAVFTHSGVGDAKYKQSTRHLNYERLEFYGDACLELIATRLIFTRFPNQTVGQQAKIRESLVNNKTISRFSIAYGFDKRLKRSAASQNQAQEIKIAADVFEAYVAAIVLTDPDNGFAVAEQWLTDLWAKQLLDNDRNGPKLTSGIAQNWKEVLQKRIGGRSDDGRDVKLQYRTDRMDGQRATMSVYLYGWGRDNVFLGRGEGLGKTEAGMRAAQNALETQGPLLTELEAQKKIYDDWRREEKAKAAAAADEGC